MEILLIYFLTMLFIIFTTIFLYSKSKRFIQKHNKINSSIPFPFSIITEKSDLAELITKILNKNFYIIGLDVEYYQGEQYKGNVCLLQITLPDKQTFLIDIISLGNDYYVKESLKKILENPFIEKVIHACDNDIKWIKQEF